MAQPTQKLTDAHRAYDTPRPFTNQIDSNRQIPERQVYSANEKFEWKIGSRSVKITGGFNEPNGHSVAHYGCSKLPAKLYTMRNHRH
jgi:hypothetical protein